LANFRNVHLNDVGRILPTNHPVQNVREFVNSLTSTTNDRSRSGGEDSNLNSVGCSFNFDSANISESRSIFDEPSNFMVLQKIGAIPFLIAVPLAVEAADDSNAQTDGMNFLSHYCAP
jgi:hypothetical protein